MPVLLGTDEAGFGPNLGPLVIVATRWDGPAGSSEELRELLADVASDVACTDKLHLTDSKSVHVSGKPLSSSPLARAARGILAAAEKPSGALREVATALDIDGTDPLADIPWFAEPQPDAPPDDDLPSRFAAAVAEAGITVRVAADVLPAGTYNDLLNRYTSKGQLLSRRTLRLLRHLWMPGEEAVIVCDKHGGRDKYGPLLLECLLDLEPTAGGDPAGGLFGPAIETLREGRLRSEYRIGRSHLTFRQKAEAHAQVACASIIAKWIRERAMDAFNDYWGRHQDTLAPTRGYPNDAIRWREELDHCPVEESLLWRRK